MDTETIFSAFQSISEMLPSIASHVVVRSTLATAANPDLVAPAPPPDHPAMAHPFKALASDTARDVVLQDEASPPLPACL
jgi:hypothetical protein